MTQKLNDILKYIKLKKDIVESPTRPEEGNAQKLFIELQKEIPNDTKTHCEIAIGIVWR